MIVLFSLAVIAAWAVVATAVVTSHDGYRRIPTAPISRMV
jgi:hypothetical protein